MTNTIQHQGIVESIDNAQIRVRIVQTTACSACSARGYCASSESKEKVIDVIEFNNSYQVGDVVLLEADTSMGMKAVLLAFVLPFVLLISFLFIYMGILQKELLAALLSLLSLVPYYLVLWLFRNQIKHKFTFKIKPIK